MLHGPTTTMRRGSSRARMRWRSRRPPATVSATASGTGRAAWTSAGEGMRSNESMLRFSSAWWVMAGAFWKKKKNPDSWGGSGWSVGCSRMSGWTLAVPRAIRVREPIIGVEAGRHGRSRVFHPGPGGRDRQGRAGTDGGPWPRGAQHDYTKMSSDHGDVTIL